MESIGASLQAGEDLSKVVSENKHEASSKNMTHNIRIIKCSAGGFLSAAIKCDRLSARVFHWVRTDVGSIRMAEVLVMRFSPHANLLHGVVAEICRVIRGSRYGT